MKGFLDRNEDKIERQRLIDDLFADTESVPNFEGYPASERVESSNSEDNSASEADTESHDEIQTGVVDNADAAAAYQTDPNLPVAKTNRYYDQTADALGGRWPGQPSTRFSFGALDAR